MADDDHNTRLSFFSFFFLERLVSMFSFVAGEGWRGSQGSWLAGIRYEVHALAGIKFSNI